MLCLAAPAAAEPLVLVYVPGPAADAIADGTDAIPGLDTAYRQAPATEDARYPTERRVGKVSGVALASLSPERMAATIRAAWEEPGVGDLVGVDEIRVAQYGPAQAANLERAMELLGPDAERVIFYAAPSTVQQIGRVDRRLALAPGLAAIRDALAAGGRTYLQLYHGDFSAFDRAEMARELTGWRVRWPKERLDRLHVVTGRETAGTAQAEIWNRVRASAAGRELLANGPGVYGLQSAGEGIRWLQQYRDYLGRPEAVPAGGDEPVPEGGGLVFPEPDSTVAPGSPLVIRLGREGRAVVTLLLPDGRTRGLRAVRVTDPVDVTVRLPKDLRTGRYRVRVTLLGDGIRDTAQIPVRVQRAPALRLIARPGAVLVTLARGNRAVIRVNLGNGRSRQVAAVRGPLKTRRVALPAGLAPATYVVVGTSSGIGGRQRTTTRVVVR
jgi:hypothetical protein